MNYHDTFETIIASIAYVVVGMIVAKTARTWFGMWWQASYPITVLLWPIVVLNAIFGRNPG